jgi:hypothetical protein
VVENALQDILSEPLDQLLSILLHQTRQKIEGKV